VGGETSLYWANNNNWASNYTYPSGDQTATFNSTANNRTNINIQGLSTIRYITFDTYNAAAFHIGTYPPGSQTLTVYNNGTLKLNANVGNSQTFPSTLRLGTDRAGSTYVLQNDSPAYTLTVLGDVVVPNSGGTTGTKTLAFNGAGAIRLSTNTGENGADCYIAAGKTLTIEPDLVSDGVFEMWSGTGTFVFKGNNDFRSNILMNTSGAIQVSKIGNVGSTGNNFGYAPIIKLSGNGCRLIYTGEGETTDRLSNTGTLTLKGGTLEFAHSGGAASYNETAGQLAVNAGSNTIFTARADEAQTSTLTFASLTRTGNGTVNFAGEGLGTADARNRVLFTSAPALVNGLIGPWAMINGTTLATYDSGLGVTAYAGYTDIAARGPGSVIPNDAALNARISTPGVDGPITLGASPVSSVNTLLQDTETAAVVTVTNTAFQTSGILLAAGKAALTIGTEPGEGAIMPLDAGGSLTVVNHDPTALLTLNAPITNNTSASSLVKAGAGTVVLAGSNTFTGAIAINDGSLAFGGSVTQTVSNAISGPGTLVKSGSGCVTLNAANTFTGPTYINEGTFVARHNTAFGTTAAGTFITDGATLDIGGGLNVDALNLGAELFTVSGSGVDGQGAIVNNHANRQLNAFGRIVLAGDTTVGAIGRWDIRQNTPSVTLNGHTFTKIGPNELCLVNAQVYGSGHIVATQGLFRPDLRSGHRPHGHQPRLRLCVLGRAHRHAARRRLHQRGVRCRAAARAERLRRADQAGQRHADPGRRQHLRRRDRHQQWHAQAQQRPRAAGGVEGSAGGRHARPGRLHGHQFHPRTGHAG